MARCEVARRTGWCGQCYAGVKGKASHRGHAFYRTPLAEVEDWVMALQRRAAAAATGKPLEAADPDAAKLAPTVVEFLTREAWDEKTPRKTGTIMVLCEDGVFKAWVHDRDQGCSCWLSGGTLLDLIAALETALANETASWRKDVRKGGRS